MDKLTKVTQEPLVSAEEQEAAAILEQMVMAQKAPEPEALEGGGKVVNKGDSDNPAPAMISSISSAGYVYMWDTRTGERSVTNRNMLPTQLKKKRLDGSRVFTVIDPGIPVRRGNLKCMLHTKDPNRERWNQLGLAVCTKENITSGYQVIQHMKHRHKEEWALIEKERLDTEKAEDRANQQAMTEAMIKISKGK